MTGETFLDGRVTQYCGDVRAVLATMPDDRFDCVPTSPPYWCLRSYLPDDHPDKHFELGLEPTLSKHLEAMVAVFLEVRRVMKPSATLWLNYGDSYATTPNGRSAAETKAAGGDDRTFRDKPFSSIGGVLKPGDLCMVPNRLAIALQEAGFWVKAECIWAKTNAMPDSSGVYRPSSAHEKIFLLTKSNDVDLWRARDTGDLATQPDFSERAVMVTTGQEGPRWIKMPFYYNASAMRMPAANSSIVHWQSDIENQMGSTRANGNSRPARPMKAVGGPRGRSTYGRHTHGEQLPESERRPDKQRGHSRRHAGFNDRWDGMTREEQTANGRLLRNYEPAPLSVWPMATEAFTEAHFATMPPELVERCIKAGCPPGGRILDPFGGAGTTALVAAMLGRTATLIELNPEYCTLARARIEAAFMGKDEGKHHLVKATGKAVGAGPLFEERPSFTAPPVDLPFACPPNSMEET